MTSNPLSRRYAKWEQELCEDSDREFVLSGIKNGFKVMDDCAKVDRVNVENYHSVVSPENRSKVEEQLKSEMRSGHYIVTECVPKIVSALAAVPKPDSEDFRLIHDCSNPDGKGLNSYASPDRFTFESVDSAVKHITWGSWMSKVDLKSAYRHVPLHPSQYCVSGLKYKFSGDGKFTYFYDTRLMMGASESVGTFHRITQSVVRMMEHRTSAKVLCYLDDFLIIAKSRRVCSHAKSVLENLLLQLGFTINAKKGVPPAQCLTFLGIEIDTLDMSLRIPKTKLYELQSCAAAWSSRWSATKREIQSLIGKISWAAKCVRAIRPCLRSLIDLQKNLKRPTHRTRLSTAVRQDLTALTAWL